MAFDLPDALVLGGGGILGEAWMSAVLAGIEEETGFDPRGCEKFVGTSAGSIVAAALAGGVSPRSRLGGLPEPPEVEPPGEDGSPSAVERALGLGRTVAGVMAAPVAAAGLRSLSVGGALVRREVLARVPHGRRSLEPLARSMRELGVSWDGRLLVSAVDLDSGRRVMFGAPGAPEVSVADAVVASCSIPGVFRPVEAGGRRYVDGGAWSPTNMDALPVRRGMRVLCLNPTGSMRPSRAAPFGALGFVSGAAVAVEALAIERRGARVRTVAPDGDTVEAIGGNLMDGRPAAKVRAAGLAQGRALAAG
jgi:NTE family protein